MAAKPIIYVEIGGKKRPVRYGRAAFGEFSAAAGLPADQMPDLEKGATLKHIDCLIWAGLWDGARKEKKEFDEDVHDVQDWLDDMEDTAAAEVTAKILEHIRSSQTQPEKPVTNGQKKGLAKQAA